MDLLWINKQYNSFSVRYIGRSRRISNSTARSILKPGRSRRKCGIKKKGGRKAYILFRPTKIIITFFSRLIPILHSHSFIHLIPPLPLQLHKRSFLYQIPSPQLWYSMYGQGSFQRNNPARSLSTPPPPASHKRKKPGNTKPLIHKTNHKTRPRKDPFTPSSYIEKKN